MRALLLLTLACGSMPIAHDAGMPDADAGPSINCAPASTFCALGSAWECTLNGHDAILSSNCAIPDPLTQQTQYGACSESECDGGTLARVGDVYCCAP